MAMIGMNTNQLYSTEVARAINRVSFELQVGDRSAFNRPKIVTLFINPTDMQISWASKNVAQETMTSNYVEEWGLGLGAFTVSGVTGFDARLIPELGKVMDGYSAYMEIENLCLTYLKTARDNRKANLNPQLIELRLHIWEDDKHFIIDLEGGESFQQLRSQDRPLLYGYRISGKILGEVGKDLNLTAQEKGQIIAFQRLNNAMQGLGEADLEIGEWLAAQDPLVSPIYQGVVSARNAIAGFQSSLSSLINGATVIGDVALEASFLTNALGGLLFGAVFAVDETTLAVFRPMRRALCATQNAVKFGSDLQSVQARVNEVTQMYADTVQGAGC